MKTINESNDCFQRGKVGQRPHWLLHNGALHYFVFFYRELKVKQKCFTCNPCKLLGTFRFGLVPSVSPHCLGVFYLFIWTAFGFDDNMDIFSNNMINKIA